MGRRTAVRDYGGVSASTRRAERRRKLLDAGRRLWGDSGIGEVTVRGVCSESGLVQRYFYEQFQNRDTLVLAVADEVRDELFASLLTVGLSEPGDLAAKLRAALKSALDVIADHPDVQRIFIDILAGTGPLTERRQQALDMVTELVLEHGPGLLDIPSPDPTEIRRGASFIVGGVSQLIGDWALNPRESTAELADACTGLCLAVALRDP